MYSLNMGRGKRRAVAQTKSCASITIENAIAHSMHHNLSPAQAIFTTMEEKDQRTLLARITPSYPEFQEKAEDLDTYILQLGDSLMFALSYAAHDIEDPDSLARLEKESLTIEQELGYGDYISAIGVPIPAIGSMKELIGEMELRFPEIAWDDTKSMMSLPLICVEPFFRQLAHLFEHYPILRSSCWSVGTYEDEDPEVIAKVQFGGNMSLNSSSFSDPDEFLARMVKHEADGFHPPGAADSGIVASHELAHTLEHLINEMILSHAERSRPGIGDEECSKLANDCLEAWIDPRRCHISNYGDESDKEMWAEAFVALEHSPRSTWPPLVFEMEKLLAPFHTTHSQRHIRPVA